MTNRELDAAVAEAMGFTWDENTTILLRDGFPLALPHYSTDFAEAWQVVEWMTKQGYDFGLSGSITQDEEPYSIWFAGFSANEHANAQADTIPLAICHAFLKAMGKEIPNEI